MKWCEISSWTLVHEFIAPLLPKLEVETERALHIEVEQSK